MNDCCAIVLTKHLRHHPKRAPLQVADSIIQASDVECKYSGMVGSCSRNLE